MHHITNYMCIEACITSPTICVSKPPLHHQLYVYRSLHHITNYMCIEASITSPTICVSKPPSHHQLYVYQSLHHMNQMTMFYKGYGEDRMLVLQYRFIAEHTFPYDLSWLQDKKLQPNKHHISVCLW